MIMTLAETEDDQRGTYIAAALAVEGLEYMSAHFLPRRRKWGREMRTWSMVRERKVVRSRTDYILGTDSRLFWNVSVWEPRHNTDHYMVLGCLHSAPDREHTKYRTGHKGLPLQSPSGPTREDRIFAALRRAVPKTQAQEMRKNGWISEDTWRLVDERRNPAKGQTQIWRLSRASSESLKGDRRRKVKAAGAEVETLLGSDPPMPREAWQWIKGWYKAGVDRDPPTAGVTHERIMAERVDLYSYVPSPGTNILISVKPFPVNDTVPT